MTFEIVLTGHKQLAKRLEHLRQSAQRRIVRPAVTKALTPINRAAKARVPKETGLLKKSIGRKVKNYPRRGIVWGAIGPRTGFKEVVEAEVLGPGGQLVKKAVMRNPTQYAHLVEFGTEPHFQPGLGIMHPGTPARPFLRPALDENRAASLRILGDTIWAGIKKEAAKR